MSWLGRILGRREGPVYGRGDVPLEPAKAELLDMLRERGARSAVIAYEGGNDEGCMCDKWGSFAGEYEVEGLLVADVAAGRIVRRDLVSVEEGPAETEVEAL